MLNIICTCELWFSYLAKAVFHMKQNCYSITIPAEDLRDAVFPLAESQICDSNTQHTRDVVWGALTPTDLISVPGFRLTSVKLKSSGLSDVEKVSSSSGLRGAESVLRKVLEENVLRECFGVDGSPSEQQLVSLNAEFWEFEQSSDLVVLSSAASWGGGADATASKAPPLESANSSPFAITQLSSEFK